MQRVLCFIITILPFVSNAQYNGTIRSARPGQTTGPYTIGKHVFQVQSGIIFNKIDNTQEESSRKTFASANTIRYGIWERLEISGVINIRKDQLHTLSGTGKRKGISGTQLGYRVNLIDHRRGWIRGLAVQHRFLLRVQSEAFRRDRLGSRFLMATKHVLSSKWALNTHWALTYTGNSRVPLGNYSVKISNKFGGGFVVMLENYGSLNRGKFDTNIDTGLAYFLSNDLKIDILGGWQGEEGVDDFFLSMGISFRIHHR